MNVSPPFSSILPSCYMFLSCKFVAVGFTSWHPILYEYSPIFLHLYRPGGLDILYRPNNLIIYHRLHIRRHKCFIFLSHSTFRFCSQKRWLLDLGTSR
jgi:hypothetical protein